MIPADVASSLRAQLPLPQGTTQPGQTLPVSSAQSLGDILSNLVPGQRILAEIQALLPNGAYRATIAQRDVTLALPFSVKPGDSLELEVVDTDGKLALAFVANRSSEKPSAESPSVPTTFSQTGRLIGDLLSGLNPDSQRAAPAPLNGNQPLLQTPPDNAALLAPALKEALTRSGVFYEAHQARWVDGSLPTESLLQEPQGKQSPNTAAVAGQQALQQPASPAPAPASPAAANESGLTSVMSREVRADAAAANAADIGAARNAPAPPSIPPHLVPIVQQQLDGLATQNFVWQGQVWPGQNMEWSIEPDASSHTDDEASGENWRTTLRLTLPHLGEVNAALRLRPGGNLELSLLAAEEGTGKKLSTALETLRQRLEDAGLRLTSFKVEHAASDA